MLTTDEFTQKFNITLDAEQRAAAFGKGKNILLLAVPGSGKTTAMIARLGYLVYCRGTDPSTVLAVTYSVAGAAEMKKRYAAAFGEDGISIRTIHSFCVGVINCYCRMKGSKPFEMLSDENSCTAIVRDVMRRQGAYPTDNDVSDAVTKITYCANMMLTDEEIERDIKLEGRSFIDIWREYRAVKRENKQMDFDDQLTFAYRILRDYPTVRKKCCGALTNVCVDEAQDTSKIQHMIIRLICSEGASLFMVGDEDQSIYGFRAAYPEGLTEFEKTYGGAEKYVLHRNYRSGREIVSAADAFICANKNRTVKNMTSESGFGSKVIKTELDDIVCLPQYLAGRLKEETGTSAVLARLNDSLLPVIDMLEENGIPFSLRGRDSLFFTHYTVSDLRDIVAFSENMRDGGLFAKLYYKFNCGLTKAEAELALARNPGMGFPDYIAGSPLFPEKKRTRMNFVSRALHSLPAKNMQAKISTVMDDVGYGAFMLGHPNDLPKISALTAIAHNHSGKEEFFHRLDTLENLVKNGFDGGGITLSTIHSAKGTEYDSVYVIDAYDGVLPSIPMNVKSFTANAAETERIREEDRRLFYVAMTRAKRRLVIVTEKKFFGVKAGGSEYADAVFKKKVRLLKSDPVYRAKALTYGKGQSIKHKIYGEGVVLSVSERGNHVCAEVIFGTGTRTIDLETCLENRLI